jgi:hypothetical protein
MPGCGRAMPQNDARNRELMHWPCQPGQGEDFLVA